MKQSVNSQPNADKKLAQEMRRLVIARMQATPKDVKISIGSNEYSKEELVDRVEKDDDVGRQIIDMQMEFLRDMAQGNFYGKDE